MTFIKSFLKINRTTQYKKKKLPIWAHPYKDLFHSDIGIIPYN